MNTKSIGVLIIVIGIAMVLYAKCGDLVGEGLRRGIVQSEYERLQGIENAIMYGGIGAFILGGIVMAVGMNENKK